MVRGLLDSPDLEALMFATLGATALRFDEVLRLAGRASLGALALTSAGVGGAEFARPSGLGNYAA